MTILKPRFCHIHIKTLTMMMTKNILSFRIFLITQTNTEMLNIVYVTEDARNL